MFTVVGAIGGALIKGYFDGKTGIALEQQKFQAELILKAIDREDQAVAVQTLKFFAEAGLISNYEKKVLRLAEDEQGAAVPALKTPSDFISVSAYEEEEEDISPQSRAVAFLKISSGTDTGYCSSILINNIGLAFPTFCLPDSTGPEQVLAVFDYVVDASPSLNTIVLPPSSNMDKTITSIALPIAGLTVAQLEDENFFNERGVPLGNRSPIIGEEVFLISHPDGRSQQISTDCLVVPSAPTDVTIENADTFAYECQTGSGSAGGPIFARIDGALLGVHAALDLSNEFRKYGILTTALLSAK